MSGVESRRRRKHAYEAARDLVYANGALPLQENMVPPSFDERQKRIFRKYYELYRKQYDWLDGFV